MAKTLTPLDASALITEIAKEATGQNALSAVTTDDFVSVGETVLATGMENTLNAISVVLGRMFVAARPYSGKLNIINEIDTGIFTQRTRKISYYSQDPQASGAWNTQIFTNLAAGFDNGENPSGGAAQSAPSMWAQKPAMPLEMNFYSHNVWTEQLTTYRDALKVAFTGPEEFARFIDGILVEKSNDISQQLEANRRLTLLNYMGGLYDVDAVGSTGQAINLRTAYNTKFSTTKSVSDLLTTDFTSFLEFLVSTIKQYSDKMTYRSVENHWTVPKTVGGTQYDILRHTPKSRQKLVLYRPLIIDAESRIFPEIFNPEFLSIENYEGVDFFQSIQSADAINVVPSIPDVAGTNSGAQKTGNAVNLAHVVGILFDADACVDNNMLDDSLTSPVEAAKKYYNTFWHFNHGSINDFTEKGILLYMAD